MTTALADIKTTRALAMQDALQEQTEIAGMLREYVKSNLVQDVDFGVIPGTKNPTLLQPGAERVAGLFRCIPEYVETSSTIDYSTGLFTYTFECRLVSIDTKTIVANGIGSATSYESKWRYRNATRVCPACGKGAIIKGKDFSGQNKPAGWLCWKKKEGCGATFPEGDQAIEGQEVGRVQNENMADLQNTVFKIAKKRSLVDASAGLSRRYGVNFDVDMEDVKENERAKDEAHGNSNHEQATPITTETKERVISGMAAYGRKWDDVKWLEWYFKRPTTLADVSEPEGQGLLKWLLAAIEDKRKKEEAANPKTNGSNANPNPAMSEATCAEFVREMVRLDRKWQGENMRAWAGKLVGKDYSKASMADITEADGLAIVAELKKFKSPGTNGKEGPVT